jgi:hypothetical protein
MLLINKAIFKDLRFLSSRRNLSPLERTYRYGTDLKSLKCLNLSFFCGPLFPVWIRILNPDPVTQLKPNLHPGPQHLLAPTCTAEGALVIWTIPVRNMVSKSYKIRKFGCKECICHCSCMFFLGIDFSWICLFPVFILANVAARRESCYIF